MRSTALLLIFVVGGWTLSAHGADWPQYRGPARDDVSQEKGLLQQWPAAGPPLVWTYENAGLGYSGPAVVGNRLYTLGARESTEFLIALDLAKSAEGSVAEAWNARLGDKFDFDGNNWSSGPSATPTVDGELVFALGGRGDLVCCQTATGREVWRKNLPQELQAQVDPIGGGPKNLGWGFTWSPLVDGNRLICLPGGPQGAVAALEKQTGAVLWRSSELKDQAAYASPVIAEFDGVRQYVVLTNQGAAGVAATDGKLLWAFRRNPRYGTEVVNTPIIHNGHVFLTVGAGQGCDLLRIVRDGDAFKAELVYANKNLANHHANVVLLSGKLYGHSQGRGWVCQDLLSGEIAWSERSKFPAGAMTCADQRLYLFSENDGTAVLLEASPEAWREAGRFKIPRTSTARKPQGKLWTPPVVANGRLYLRDQELLFAFDIRAKQGE